MNKYNKIINYETEPKSPLVKGENLLWSAKPKKSAYIINQILTMMPIAILWLAVDSSFIISMTKNSSNQELTFIIPFFALHLMPVWIWLVNALTANKKWQNTKYYVTDKRIIIQNGFFAENYQTIYYNDIKNIDLKIGMIDKILNVGDIYIDLGYYHKDRQKKFITGFLDIENAQEIYLQLQKIIMDIQTDIEYPNALRPNQNPGYNTKYDGKIS